MRGLSPRVRGNREKSTGETIGTGPIPACAGQPHIQDPTDLYFGAYPRVCGATTFGKASTQGMMGLSPRVRGNLEAAKGTPPVIGPIPACAGQPQLPAQICGRQRAYPRVCGATLRTGLPSLLGGGLSPRVRGNRRPNHIAQP